MQGSSRDREIKRYKTLMGGLVSSNAIRPAVFTSWHFSARLLPSPRHWGSVGGPVLLGDDT